MVERVEQPSEAEAKNAREEMARRRREALRQAQERPATCQPAQESPKAGNPHRAVVMKSAYRRSRL